MLDDAGCDIGRAPPGANRLGCFEGEPFARIAANAGFNIDMGKPVRLKPDRDKPRRVTDAFEQRRQQHALVIAIARADAQNGVGGVNRFDAVNVFQIADVIADEFMERRDFPRPILLRQRACQAYRFLADRRACFSLFDQSRHDRQCRFHPGPARRYFHED